MLLLLLLLRLVMVEGVGEDLQGRRKAVVVALATARTRASARRSFMVADCEKGERKRMGR